jgi:hypothetical protein
MARKQLYGVYVFLTPDSARAFKVDLYGGERASTVDEALQSFMRRFQLFSVELALVMSISEQGEITGGEFRLQVSCEGKRHDGQPPVSDHFQQMMNRLLPLE